MVTGKYPEHDGAEERRRGAGLQMIEDIKKKMRAIPGMDILLAQDWALPWVEELGRETVKRILNGELTRIRRQMLTSENTDLSPEGLRKVLESLLAAEGRPRPH